MLFIGCYVVKQSGDDSLFGVVPLFHLISVSSFPIVNLTFLYNFQLQYTKDIFPICICVQAVVEQRDKWFRDSRETYRKCSSEMFEPSAK